MLKKHLSLTPPTLFLLMVFHAGFAIAQQTSNADGAGQSQMAGAQQLQMGKAIEREMTGADAHAYFADLKKGDLLDLAVEQRGMDVILRLYAPDNQLLGEFDSPNGAQGPEPLRMTAETSGRYRLEIRPFTKDAKAGRYAVNVKELRAASKTELEVAALDKQYLTAWAAGDAGTLAGIVAEDFVYTPYYGVSSISVQDKSGFLAAMKRRVTEGEKVSFTTRGVRVHDYGDAAIVTGRTDSKFNAGSLPMEQQINFTRSYVRRNNRWQLIAAQSTGYSRSLNPFKADPNSYDAYVGEYQFALDPKIKAMIKREGDKLMIVASNGNENTKIELLPEAPSLFYVNSTTGSGGRFMFVRNESGQVTGLIGVPYISAGGANEFKKISTSQQ